MTKQTEKVEIEKSVAEKRKSQGESPIKARKKHNADK